MADGFAALERKEYFTSDIVYSNLTFWGWVFLVWGALELIAGGLILQRRLAQVLAEQDSRSRLHGANGQA